MLVLYGILKINWNQMVEIQAVWNAMEIENWKRKILLLGPGDVNNA